MREDERLELLLLEAARARAPLVVERDCPEGLTRSRAIEVYTRLAKQGLVEFRPPSAYELPEMQVHEVCAVTLAGVERLERLRERTGFARAGRLLRDLVMMAFGGGVAEVIRRWC